MDFAHLTAHRHFLTADLTTWISKIPNVYGPQDDRTGKTARRSGRPLVTFRKRDLERLCHALKLKNHPVNTALSRCHASINPRPEKIRIAGLGLHHSVIRILRIRPYATICDHIRPSARSETSKLPRSQVPFVQSSEKSRCHSFSQNFPLFDHFVPLFPHFVPVCTSLYHFVPLCTTLYRFVPLCTSFSSLRTVTYRYGLISYLLCSARSTSFLRKTSRSPETHVTRD